MSQYSPYYSGGGGGFLQGGSQPSPGGGQRSEAAMSIRPITAAQFLKAMQAHGDGPWSLDGYEIGHVTAVGQVISIQQQTTNHTYFIDDGTGRIEAKHWVGSVASAEAEMEKWKGIEEGTYVRLSGFMKSFSNKKYINASFMRPIEDFNEIYFHLLECITVTLTLERGPPYASGGGGQKGTGGSSAYQLGSDTMDTRDEYSDLPPPQQKIVRFILAENKREGVHVGLIARAIGKDADAEQISAALDALLDGGILYNTIDDSHFTVSR